jgi:hypothetical protein
MRGTTGICLALLLVAAPAMAADEDTQVWITGTLAGSLAKDVSGSLDVSQRFRETSGDQQLVRGIADFRLSSHVSVGGGITYVWVNGPNEWRPHQQVTFTLDKLSLRTTLEERLFDGADRAELRLRERARVTLPVGKATRVAGTAEFLYILQPHDRLTQARVDSLRGTVAVQQKLSPHLDGSIGYMFVDAPRSGAPDRISHVPQIGLTWRP